MPRAEQPLDGDDALTAFASGLWALRQEAGMPPYRRLAREAHSGGADDKILIWNIAAPTRPVAESDTDAGTGDIEQGAFSPDGLTLATAGSDYAVRLWNTTDPHRLTEIGAPLTGSGNWVLWVGFPHQGMLASTDADGTVRLWNIADLAAASADGRPLTDHTAAIDNAALSPNGTVLATASDDHTVQLTSLDVNQAIARVCATTANTLTQAVWQKYGPGLPYTPPCV